MRLVRSLRASASGRLRLVCAAATLALSMGCGGGAAPPTSGPTSTASVAPVASPQRPQLASPVASAAPTTPATPTSSAEMETYDVQPGDTLLSIAEQFYGDSTKWRRIYDANRDVIGDDPDKLKVDTKLKIPPKES